MMKDKDTEQAGKEGDEVAKAPPEVLRRVLRFVNAARLPEDFLQAPQEVRDTVGEHGREHEGMVARHAPKLDQKLAQEIIRRRPLLGFADLDRLIEIDRRRILDWLRDLLRFLSASLFGEWSTPIPISVGGGPGIPIQNAALLRTGKVLLIPSGTDTVLWNPDGAPAFTVRDGATTGLTANLFCSGHSFLSDGKVLVAGGGGGGPGQASSIQAWKFDPNTETWQKTVQDMAYRRWYPTVVTLGDEPGRALVASGWTGEIVAGNQVAPPRMEIYSETTDSFTQVTASGLVGEKRFEQTYPGLHLLPGGEIFYAAVGFGNCSQSASVDPDTDPTGYFVFGGTAAGAWTNTGADARTKGMSVLLLQPTYPFVQVLVVGGGTAAQSATARLINLSTLSPAWGEPFPLLEARVHPNAVLLPDGTVFICGGMEETATPPTGGRCELYDPAAGTLREMAALSYPRHYHSVALLLPNGKVMAAGGASPGGCSLSAFNTIEVFSPPYLFRGARPAITALPGLVHHGQSFEITTPDADDVARVVLVRPMAVTHQTDSEQRVVTLQFARTAADRLTATMPDGVHPHGMAPRGYYLLFILKANGVPSEGRFIYLH
jgi:hypothetical protein